MSTKEVLNRADSLFKVQAELKLAVEKELELVKKEHKEVNNKIQHSNSVKNKAEADVRSCIANLHSTGISKEAFPALDAARDAMDKAMREHTTVEAEKHSEALQNDISALEDVLKRIS